MPAWVSSGDSGFLPQSSICTFMLIRDSCVSEWHVNPATCPGNLLAQFVFIGAALGEHGWALLHCNARTSRHQMLGLSLYCDEQPYIKPAYLFTPCDLSLYSADQLRVAERVRRTNLCINHSLPPGWLMLSNYRQQTYDHPVRSSPHDCPVLVLGLQHFFETWGISNMPLANPVAANLSSKTLIIGR